MSHFINNKQNIKTLSNGKKINKKSNISQKLHYLKTQIVALKQIHKNVMKMVNKISKIIPSEMFSLFNMLLSQFSNQNPSFINPKKEQSQLIDSKIIQVKQKDSQIQIQKIKITDMTIKNQISSELKALKMLEHKEKELRFQNQKQGKLRRSLSKQSIFMNCLKQIYNEPRRYNKSSRLNTLNHLKKYPQISTEQRHYSLQNSPTFGSSIQQNSLQTFQSFKQIKQFNQSPVKIQKQTQFCLNKQAKTQTLFCPYKHEYYKGQLSNNLPHGKGALIVCCQKIPIKINSKTLRYYGNFQNGAFQGQGIMFCKGNIKFQGMFFKGKRKGEGIINLDGKSQKGIWQNDKLISFI